MDIYFVIFNDPAFGGETTANGPYLTRKEAEKEVRRLQAIPRLHNIHLGKVIRCDATSATK